MQTRAHRQEDFRQGWHRGRNFYRDIALDNPSWFRRGFIIGVLQRARAWGIRRRRAPVPKWTGKHARDSQDGQTEGFVLTRKVAGQGPRRAGFVRGMLYEAAGRGDYSPRNTRRKNREGGKAKRSRRSPINAGFRSEERP